MKKGSLHIALPIVILIELAGLGVTIYGYNRLHLSAVEADQARFESLVDAQMEDITARLDSYEALLYSGVGLLNGSQVVTSAEWRNYVLSVPLQKTAPGILGVGTISPVAAEDRRERIKWFERERGDHFQYKTVGGVEPPEGMSYIIDRIEPLERNRSALGLDVGSEANRREAYEKARDTGEAQVTGIITLVQDDMKMPGFLLMIPRYEMGLPKDTVEERRLAFREVVYAPMIGKDILTLPSQSTSREVAFSVYDEQESPDRLIYYTADPRGEHKASHEKVFKWPYAGRQWLIHTWATPDFVSKAAGSEPRGFLYFGIALSTLLAALLFMLHRSHGQALRLMGKFQRQADEKTNINNLFVEHAPAAIAILDSRLHFMAASQRWMKQFGMTEEIIGKHHHEVFPQIHDMPEWLDAHERALQGEHVAGGDDRFVRSDGTLQYLRWEILPWEKSPGEIGGIIIFSMDVTEEVENRRYLEEAQREVAIIGERLRQATEAGNIGIWDWRIKDDELIWNDQMFDLFGMEARGFSGHIQDFKNGVLPEDRPKVEEAMRGTLEEDLDFEIEYRTVREDNPTLLAIGQVHRDKEGKPIRMLGVCVDVSEQVRMRMELKRAIEHQAMARREAENMAKAREQFLATMSHELRTPMNGVIGMSELLLATELDKKQQEFVNTIIECGQSLLSLINDILDVSKIEAGGIHIENKSYSPRDLFERVAKIASKQTELKGLNFKQSIDSEVPSSVMGDVTRLQQVLLNLLSNAVKFTKQGCIQFGLHQQALPGGRAELVYEVADTGLGMSEEELERVFIPFVQADASITRKYGGTGLGLSISRSLVLLMGGTLRLSSKPGEGTRAVVRIPVSGVPADPGLPAHSAGNESHDEHGSQAPKMEKVLIVEDNPINQRVTQLQMKRFAHETDIAADGKEALVRFRESGYDLILMDCQMPVMDGFEATRCIRREESERGLERTPIVALTANVQERDKNHAMAAGMDGFLSKPLKLEDLKKELDKFH